MTIARAAGVAQADGADLYFERRGDGPPLLLIAGGGGDGGAYVALAEYLADAYTVVTYDRRGNSRSRLRNDPVKIKIAEQSADAIAVLRASGFESARIFGNSGGATIALDLAAHHPQVVQAVVPHEPPVPRVLPDADTYLAVYGDIEQALGTDGWQAAFRLFQVRVGHTPADQPAVMTVLLDPAQVLPPGPHLDLMKRLSGNWQYMITYEVQSFIRYLPDLDRIADSHVRIALAAGADTIALGTRGDVPDDPCERPSAVIAERLGTELAEFPGGHLAPFEIPGAFGNRLRSLLERL